MIQDSEQWRVIPSFPVYEASTYGNLRRIVPATSKKFGKCCKTFSCNGYRALKLYMGGKRYDKYVHQLVAEAFHGPIPDGHFTDHKDTDKWNNQPGNLTYITRKESCQQGNQMAMLGDMKRGEDHHTAVFTVRIVRQIRRLREHGWSYAELGRKFGKDHSHIRQICTRHIWAHVK